MNRYTRGFGAGSSAHEQIDSVGLVYMNGRVYDPELGRFASVEPSLVAPKPLN